MRSTIAARLRGLFMLAFAMIFALSCASSVASANEADNAATPLVNELVSSRTFALPASAFSDASAITITSGVVELSAESSAALPMNAFSVVRTTYVVAGCVYTFDHQLGEFTLVNAANAELTDEGYLVVPSALVLDDAEYPVTSVAAGALSNVKAPLVALSSSIASIDAEAFANNIALQAAYVSPNNRTYISYDGCLYANEDNQPIRLLLIPGGRTGAVRIISGAEVADREAFSHCAIVDEASADAGSAAFSSRNVLTPETDDETDISVGVDTSEVDYAAVVVDENVFAPVAVPDASPALFEAERGFSVVSTDSLPDALVENEVAEEIAADSGLSIEEASSYATAPSRYLVNFDLGEGVADPAWTLSAEMVVNDIMPDIRAYANNAPKREKYVFMGFYDGSDYTRANRYYDQNLKRLIDSHPFGCAGLTLYAGWAPVLSVDVPTFVSFGVGTQTDMDAPEPVTVSLSNLSPWPVECDYMKWDDTEIVGEIDKGLVANRFDSSEAGSSIGSKGEGDTGALQASNSSLPEMFNGSENLRLSVSDGTDTVRLALGDATSQAEDLSHIRMGAGSLAAPQKLSLTYLLELNGAGVAQVDKVSNTTLVTSFRASSKGPDGLPVTSAKHSVVFDMNDGGETDYRLAAREMAYGERPANLLASDASVFVAPERYGHGFLGFFDSPTDFSEEHKYFDEDGAYVRLNEKGQLLWDKTSATVLYAGWSTSKVRVVFDGNGGTVDGPVNTTKTVEIEYGSDLSTAPLHAWPWAQAGSASDPIFNERQWSFSPYEGPAIASVSDVRATTTDTIYLYALWTDTGASIEVTFDACGGKVNGKAKDTRTITLGSDFESLLPSESDESNKVEREGYRFAGWWTEAEGGVRVTTAPATLKPLMLYAHWDGDNVTVSWNTGGWSVANPSSHTYVYDGRSTIGAEHFPHEGIYGDMNRGSGYTWNGWYAKGADGVKVGSPITSASLVPATNATYFAFWDIDITWDANGGSAVAPTRASLSDSVAVALPAYPVRDGYICEGWFTSLSGGTKLAESVTVSGPTTFIAQWKKANIVIAWDTHGGNTISDQEARPGNAIEFPDDPVRVGYTFAGWWSAEEGGEQIQEGASVPDGDTVYHAHWQPVVYTIALDKQSGSGGDDAIRATYGKVLDDIAKPSRPGYAFDGYWTKPGPSDYGTCYYTANGTSANTWMETDVDTLYAKWDAETYTITYNVREGENPSNWPTGGGSVAYGASYALSSAVPTRAGYDFLGWSTSRNAPSVAYEAGETIENITGSIELYAVWIKLFEPKALIEGDTYLYLDLDEDAAKSISTNMLRAKPGRFGATQIKAVAEDISQHGASSEYFALFMNIMRDDVKFKTKWYDIKSTFEGTINPSLSDIDYASTSTYDVRIIGLYQDYLNADKTGKRAGITFQFADVGLTYRYRMNNRETNVTGWKNSELRARMNSTNASSCSPQPANIEGFNNIADGAAQSIWKRVPRTIQEKITPVYKFTHNAAGNDTTETVSATRDQLFLASYAEMTTRTSTYSPYWREEFAYTWMPLEGVKDDVTKEGFSNSVYQFYSGDKRDNVSMKEISGSADANPVLVKKFGTTVAGATTNFWWERTCSPNNAWGFMRGFTTGSLYSEYGAQSGSWGIVPCFCF